MSYLSVFRGPIIAAFLAFPFLAFLFTFPFVYREYRKFNSVPVWKTVIVYTFVYYLLNVFFLVVLPLPARETVVRGHYLSSVALTPFCDYAQYFTRFGVAKATILHFFISKYFLQTAFNVAMLIPFGFFLRYYFRQNLKKTILFSLLLSLFFEVTQLTGLWFLYPGPYRCFDITDLICNTLGGVLGYWLAPILIRVLPNREKLDVLTSDHRVDGLQLVWAFLIDFTIFIIPTSLIAAGILWVLEHAGIRLQYALHPWEALFGMAALISFCYLLYLMLLSLKRDGRTPGRSFCNIHVRAGSHWKSPRLHIAWRYGMLIVELCVSQLAAWLLPHVWNGSWLPAVRIVLYSLLPLFVLRYVARLFRTDLPMLYEWFSGTEISCYLDEEREAKEAE